MTDQLMEVSTSSDEIENLYLTFEADKETYAVNIRHVTEIVGMQRISAMPDVPDFIKGAMNLRGKVIPVMDVRLRFGLPEQTYDDRTTIIVLDLDGIPTGLVVDKVTDVLTILPENIEPPPQWHGKSKSNKDENQARQGVIKGLGKHDDRVSIILDIPRLLSVDLPVATISKPEPENNK
ncbi:MAG: chemotaxis protein CheW [Anaerolineae bacterium]|nr:chemotaxis protein CheW [Anaerolineae bacterium]